MQSSILTIKKQEWLNAIPAFCYESKFYMVFTCSENLLVSLLTK